MQLRFATDLSANEYVRQKAWKDAKLNCCPLHPEGGCGFARHGTNRRKFPAGAKIARWFSLFRPISSIYILNLLDNKMVEAAGVEPASENIPHRHLHT